MGRRWVLMPAVALLVTAVGTACGANGPATEFCTGYGDALRGLVVAARDYEPAAFDKALESTMSTFNDLRADAPDDTLREAFGTASFTFTVFSSNELLADFLRRADFSDNAVVRTCADYGVELDI